MWLFGRNKNEKPKGKAEVMPRSPRSILLVVDGSEQMPKALAQALELSVNLGASLLATYVVDTAAMEYLSQLRVILPEERDEFRADMQKRGRRYLLQAQEQAVACGATLETELAEGHFDQTILNLVRTRQIDLIVMCGWHRSAQKQDEMSRARLQLLDRLP